MVRQEVVDGLQRELQGFVDLVRSLDDVAAHVAGSLTDITSGRVDGQEDPEVTARQVAERRGRGPAEIADELERGRERNGELMAMLDDVAWASPAPGGYDMTLGEAVGSLWSGYYVHADDIRSAVGRASDRGPGLRASVHHLAGLLTRRGWGPAVLALDGLEEVPVGGASDGPGGRRVVGDPLTFVLVATGRADPGSLGLDASVDVFA
jgi:uncharacterized protein (TIGR03083 family)